MTVARGLRPSRIAATIVAAVAVLVVANPPANADEIVAQPAAGDVRLELIEQDFSFLPNGTIHLEYRLTGLVGDPLELEAAPEPVATTTTTTTAPADPEAAATPTTTAAPPPPPPEPIQLKAKVTNYEPITSSSDVGRVVGSDVDPDEFAEISDAVDGVVIDIRPLATIGADGTVTFALDVPTDLADSGPDGLKFDRPGLSPLRVQVVVGDTDDEDVVASAGTIVQRLPTPTDPPTPPPIDLSVVVATPDPGPGAAASTVDDAARELGAATDLAATLDAPLTLEVPPTLVTDAASTPTGSADLAAALDGDEFVATPLVPLDVSSAVAAGRSEAYTRLVIAGADALTEAVPTTPTRRDVWITTSALSVSGAQHLRDLGARFVIVPEEVYRDTIGADLPATDLFVDAALPDGGRLPLLVVDHLSDELVPTAADEILDDSTATEWAVSSTARMVLDQARDDASARGAAPASPPAERSRILSTPDLHPPDDRLLDALVQLASTTPSVRFAAASSLTGVTDVQRGPDGPVTVTLPEVAGPSLAERIALIDDTALHMVSAASMLPADDPRPAEWAAELDALVSTGYSDEGVEAVTSELRAEADRLRDAVVLPDPFTFTLTGRSGTIEVRLGNTTDERLNVVVRPQSTKVDFPDGDQMVELRPLDETSVIVPVEAQSNGTSSIELSVFAPGGELLAEPVTLTARVTALTGLGQVLTGGLVLVLLTWWFTHWRKRRRATVDADVDSDGEDDGEDAGEQDDGDEQDRQPEGEEVESDTL